MKFILALTVMAASAMLNETSVSRQLQATPPPYCWLGSYARGVGTVPKLCAQGQELIGLLCYDNCPCGMSRKGLDCHSDCPKDMADQGLFCRKKEYARGAGYPWKIGDAFDDDAMFKRCEHDNGGRDTCEKYGLVVYPKCKEGFTSFGCCMCRPSPPDCEKLGLAGRIGLSCAKKIIIGSPHLRTCAPYEELSAGLCYKKCLKGFHGIGPICWNRAPPEWFQCGTGATKTSEECEQIKTDKILSVASLVLKITTEFSSSSEEPGTPSSPRPSFKTP
ncbi:hypothetical protein H310_11622 [Aphanomyces invadans]|uniref:Uncharacterized protein n=1 Tax=Aphanomyces invadans TaxID=157072 RepID=A0A024TNT0_9STRA|nr:hypothetical protein H310_11622 [Aphanomyces invadans]ETV94982.1 hypothetical protein H310_11622 [Aphanomyces invadans]|eukprot:XP_008876573.1 hypothetical protein H310_11622 [Aphanomyces invadans]